MCIIVNTLIYVLIQIAISRVVTLILCCVTVSFGFTFYLLKPVNIFLKFSLALSAMF